MGCVMSDYTGVPESDVIVSVDWFALSCKLSRPYDGRAFNVPMGWTMVECGGTAVWSYRWFLLDSDGNKVATILTKPKSSIIDERRCVVEIANPYLYRDDFIEVVNRVCDVYPMSIEGMNRVDLCGDFNMTERQYLVFRMLQDGTAYLKGVRRGADWHEWKKRQKNAHQQSWGGKDSVFHWKMYYKYKELHEGGIESSKPYIDSMWRQAGLDVKHVWRLEVSVTSSNSLERTDGGGKIMPFEWYEQRDVIYDRLYRDKFVIRENMGHTDARNDPVLHFFRFGDDWSAGKMLRHRTETIHDIESSVERRVVCRMWKEFRDDEVRANDYLLSSIADFLRQMFVFPRNIAAVSRRFNLSEAEILHALQTLE